MLEIGSLVDGKYRILRVVGKGGMSVVYQAVNEKANKIWAIKEVRKDGVQNFEVVKQNLIVETDLLKRLKHPNLPDIIDVIDTDDSFLIVMDYIEGNSLSKALETSGAQSQDDVIEWAKQLCDVLGYLHSRERPIIYRDMKPANVMLKPDGTVSLIDFGTAREFKSSSVEDTTCLGTQGYAAPEQYGGHGQTDARTDIYCLGATMYHLVTGHNPCTPPYEMYPIRQWNPLLSEGLEEIITKCTQRNPNDRYQSCAELLYDLDHIEELDKVTRKEQAFKWKIFLTTVIIMLVMIVGAVGFKIAGLSATDKTYDGLLSEAEDAAASASGSSDGKDGTEVFKDAVAIYKEAITIEPGRTDAYYGLLDLYMDDSKLSMVENNDISSTLKEEKNLNALVSSNREEFAKLAKEVADDLFFCYESGFEKGIATSTNWYRKALDYTNNEQMTDEINRYMMIAKCYIDANKMDSKGNLTGVDPNEVFDALTEVVDTLNPKENIVVSLKCYNFISVLLGNKVDVFIGKVPLSDYNALLDKIDEKLSEIEKYDIYIDNKGNNQNLLENTLNQARDNVAADRRNGYGASGEGIGG